MAKINLQGFIDEVKLDFTYISVLNDTLDTFKMSWVQYMFGKSRLNAASKALVSVRKKVYPLCLVLVGSRNCLFHNQTKIDKY